ncbi:glucose-6-phosphate dehydrogenase assembly protein OpcA [Propionibacterium sp. oral taxon 192 str. F0372]|uniref:glucose-6-phosphate dehydrogenase assembly protein OpcA n=1 Tax=Propionibacterium sp. oral taxon 192 TaxID=671222 RepID=UPI000352D65E|nr:glucose-6-phosphate dehydrogenase assembly protein OpcA [Propionibacterium sp. oral taxon 192]EPH00324.1 glucose-6-phosphate dehydrogenase assembly protein OpcA [Propionibacterium sp. oral taxon 192 str. F0372]
MMRLENTDARQINQALNEMRDQGRGASGQVLTLVINIDAYDTDEAMHMAEQAAEQHPSRILVARRGGTNTHPLNAAIKATSSTEVITLDFSGQMDRHVSSVLLPLLLPELPVVVWWPTRAPNELYADELCTLTNRLIVDSARATHPTTMLANLARDHRPCTTDLAWARLTRWRALLVAALDQARSKVLSASVTAPADSTPSDLMAAWLELKLSIAVERPEPDSGYPGLQSVELLTEAGPVVVRRISRTDAVLSLPGQPEREVALARRTMKALITEELTRLSGDTAFDELMDHIAKREG